jgi:hypothetical protein
VIDIILTLLLGLSPLADEDLELSVATTRLAHSEHRLLRELELLRAELRAFKEEAQSGPAPNGIQLQAQHSAACLDVSGASASDGAAVVQWTCHGHSNQLWRAEPVDGHWMLRSLVSGKCLEVPAWSMTSGTTVMQWTCNGGANQQWRFEAVDDFGTYRLIARHSGQCLEVPAWSQQGGAQAGQWACNGGLNQQWRVIEY